MIINFSKIQVILLIQDLIRIIDKTWDHKKILLEKSIQKIHLLLIYFLETLFYIILVEF